MLCFLNEEKTLENIQLYVSCNSEISLTIILLLSPSHVFMKGAVNDTFQKI
jgi:hypothetical protein